MITTDIYFRVCFWPLLFIYIIDNIFIYFIYEVKYPFFARISGKDGGQIYSQ